MPQDQQKKPLGLGLGLGAAGRAGFRNAASGGNLASFLGSRANAQRRFIDDFAGKRGASRQTAAQSYAPNTGAPGTAGNKPSPRPTTAPVSPMSGPPAATPPMGGTPNTGTSPMSGPPATGDGTFGGFLNNTFGANNPFGTRGNYSDPNNPIYGAAKSNLDQALAGIRARYAGSGLGNSGREALAEGQATADFGNQIATLGEQAYQNDASRALQAALGGQQNLLGLNNALSQAGAGLTGIGQGEQTPAGQSGLMALLGLLTGQSGVNTGNVGGKQSWYTR